MLALPAPPLHAKRPRGLWKGRRDVPAVPLSKPAFLSHDYDLDSLRSASTTTHAGDVFDDDLDDGHSSDSSCKRRRLSAALSDTDTLCLPTPPSRSLTPDLACYAHCVPTHPLKSPSYSPPVKSLRMHQPSADSDSSINHRPRGKQPTTTDIEDWENLKELFARASESYESDTSEALPLLRAVIRECHRFMLAHPDPSLVYSQTPPRKSRSPRAATPTGDRATRDWAPETLENALKASSSPSPSPFLKSSLLLHPRASPAEPPTAFHTIFGTALFYMGVILSQDATLALPDEPATPATYWLAALDVFETGESLPSVVEAQSTAAPLPEDWRMAVSWGRALVCLADAKVEHARRTPPPKVIAAAAASSSSVFPAQSDLLLLSSWSTHLQAQSASTAAAAGPFSLVEPRWPTNSPFYAITAARPPVTRRTSLNAATAHDVMVLAMDQFSRGIFHMPHPHYSHSHNPTSSLHFDAAAPPPPSCAAVGAGAGWRCPASAASSSPTSSTGLSFSRPKELFTIASELLGVAERLSKASQREYWAAQADSVFNQMKMEAPDVGEWRMTLNVARGRCWLVIGDARDEALEDALERGDLEVLHTAEAEEARESLAMAVTFLERAKGSATAQPNPDQDDLSPLLAEALLTLANLTADENTREELYARAQAEGGDAVDLELDPRPTALPAAIGAIAASARRQTSSLPSLEIVVDGARPPAPSLSVEASPAVMFAASRMMTTSAAEEEEEDNNNALGLDRPVVFADGSFSRREELMDES